MKIYDMISIAISAKKLLNIIFEIIGYELPDRFTNRSHP